ncbi:hypothetical protein GNY06_05280 [Elizabethkingia argentiflava]|uniref:DNA repair protein n=1 Tax=Elizabethkingia argenteiflava TaxID=2681556 RepID=A0A845PVB9_9FLAO|nr:hypothetical protein [Elizabethkingia argenteiflava]NAW50816.1 hypothetical protein [Elizabethkingia argenteiflava]
MANKGSEWRKWDFHIHTKGTNKNDKFSSPTMDDFFCLFFKKAFEHRISAIAITDYFSIERYLEAIEYRSNIENKVDEKGEKLFSPDEITFIKSIFIFPNVELRMLPATDKGRLINIHCVFNPEYVGDLENDFFSHIANQDGVKMNRHGITSYGKSLDPNINELHKQYEKGIENFVIDLKSLRELISTNKRFKDNTLLIVSNSNNDGASGTQKHYDLFENESGNLDGLRRSIYYISDGIFSANPKDVKYFIGKRLEGTDGYNETIYKKEVENVILHRGSLKPCIVGCDAHIEDDLFSKFTWVKGNLNFEGLRQICFEPESRVKIQIEEPDFKEEKLIIEQVSFISPKNTFSNVQIYLNPNLNVVIGGKSSGKSILLYAIAKTLSADQTVLQNDDGTDKYDLNKIDDGFDFQITTKGGFTQKLIRLKDENSILPEIKYIPQNYLVKLAEPELNKKGKSLNKLVRDLITEDDTSKEWYQDFITKVSQNDKLRNTKIDLYFETQDEIDTLEADLKTKSSKAVLDKNIETNTSKVEELNNSTGLTPEQVAKYNALQTKLEGNNTKLQNFKDDFSAIQSLNSELAQNLKSLKQKKDTIVSQLQLQEIKSFYETEYAALDALLAKIDELNTSIEVQVNDKGTRSFTKDCKFRDVLLAINKEQKITNTAIQPYLKDEQVKKSIEVLNQSIANDKKSLSDIDTLSKKIQDKKKLLAETKEEIFTIYKNSYQHYPDIITALKVRTVELEKDGLGIDGKAQFNYSKLWEKIYAISDRRSASYNDYTILGANKKATDTADFDLILQDITKLFDDLITKKYALTNRTSVQAAIKIILDDYFFDYWDINYKNDKLGEMSTGKASFVILMLIIGLSKSKAPILIDQPEDNLDNRSITTDLVNYLRSKKLERQIIIVTHNANIVVNADAENVIIANQKGQNEEQSTSVFKFDYINGAIENSFDKRVSETDLLKSMGIRQHIADIVEGGKDAFMMREKKYRFH